MANDEKIKSMTNAEKNKSVFGGGMLRISNNSCMRIMKSGLGFLE